MPVRPISTSARLLVAASDAPLRESMRCQLEFPCQVIEAADAPSAWEAAHAHSPDLVLCEATLSGLDEFSLLPRLRADPATGAIPIVLVSAREAGPAAAMQASGAPDDFLFHPFSACELQARIRSNLEMGRLRRAQRHDTDILDSITDGFLVLGRDWRILSANQRAEDILAPRRQSPGRLVGKTIWEEFPTIRHTPLEEACRRAMTGREVVEMEWFYTPLASWFCVRILPARDGLSVFFQDISARKQAEERGSYQKTLLEALTESVIDGILIVSLEGRIIQFNQRFVEIWNLPADIIAAKSDEAALQWAASQTADPAEFLAGVAAIYKGGNEAIRGELRMKDGRVYERCGSPVENGGARLGWVWTFRNITRQKRAEAILRKSEVRYRTLFNSINAGFCVIEVLFDSKQKALDYRFLEVNPAFEMQTDLHDATGKCMRAMVPDHEEDWFETYGKIALTGAPCRFEKHAAHLHRWYEVYAFRVDQPELHHVGVLFNDITRRRETEETLRLSKEHAERASRAKDDFLAALSHELRTPLNPVLLSVSALREDKSLPAAVREEMAMIERNIALEAHLIDDLLDITRIARGKLALRAVPCDIHSLLALVVEMVREEARARQIELGLELCAHESHLTGDPARLQQVFWNLLRNAVKFTPPKGRVRIYSRDCGSQSAPRLRIEVHDNGIGLDADATERIFKPFEQASATQEHRFGGLGLGLAIARAIVDRHHGELRAQSAGLGCGSTFTVELPGTAPAGRQPPAPACPASAHAAGASRSSPPMRLLVVEDHEASLQVLTRLLTRAGHSVIPAATVAAARCAAAAHPCDAVISDIGLPDGSGLELMEELRSAHGLRGIVLSGYGMDDDLHRSRQAGVIAHLTKPVDLNELRQALRLLAPVPEH